MDSSDSDDAGAEVLEYTDKYQLHGVGLKPVLDDIFKEVQANIPVLNFEDTAETSSDEDQTVFSRSSVPLPKIHFSQEVMSPDSGLGKLNGHTASSSTMSDHIQMRSEEDLESPDKTPFKPSSDLAVVHTVNTKGSGSYTSPGSIADQVKLNVDKLDLIDFGHLSERWNEVSVSAGTPLQFDASDSDSETEADDRDSFLMRELESLQKRQLEAAIAVQTDCLLKAAEGSLSKGVSACLDPPSTTPPCTEDTSAKRETVFLDLRKQNDKTTEQKRNHILPSSIQRILGIDQDRGSSSSSDEDDDDDVVSWQQHRQRVKEGLLQPGNKGTKPATEQKQKHQQNPDQCQKASVKNITEDEMCEKSVQNKTAPSSVETQLNSVVEGPKKLSKKGINVSRGTSTAPLDLRMMHQDADMAIVDRVVKDRQLYLSDERPSNFSRDPVHEHVTYKATEMQVAEKSAQDPSKSNTGTREEKTPEKQVSDGTTQTQAVSTKRRAEKKRGDSGCCSLKEPRKEEKDCSSDPSSTKDSEMNAKKRDEISKALDAQMKAKRARLRKSLENLRPPLSSGGHQPAAPATPVVFDQEASYEQSVEPLPLDVPGRSCLLLCAKLASCGELANSRGGPKGGLRSDTHSFSSLVAWLLCLVPPPEDATGFRNMAALCDVPFHVIGLQQKWHEGQLSVDVAIRSRCDTSLKLTHSQSNKHSFKGGNSFKQTVTKFLSTNSLQGMFDKISALTSTRNQYLSSLPKRQRNLSTLLSVNPDPDAMGRVFGIRPGFFWQTMELEDFDCGARSISCPGPEIQNTLMAMRYDAFHLPFCALDVMTRVWREGLSVAGLRLVYTNASASDRVDSDTAPGRGATDPLFILAIRGPNAVSVWLDEVGPQDAGLARLTDPNSLRAMYSKNAKEDRLFSCPRTCSKAVTELARWFGGRVPENGVINVGTSNHILPSSDKVKSGNKVRPGSDHLITSSLHSSTPRPPCFLTATVHSLVFLVLSPLVPVKCLGYVLSVCYDRGFVVQGVRRTQLNSRRVAGLGLSPEQVSVFCPLDSNSTSSSGRSSPTLNANIRTVFSFAAKSPLHIHSNIACTVLLLSKENGLHHVLSLTEVLANDLKGFSLFHPSVLSQLCFVAMPFSDVTLKQLGGSLSLTPDPSIYSASLWRHSFYSNRELEQVCVLTLLRDKATASGGIILDHLLLQKPLVRVNTVKAHGTDDYYGFELLGLKLMSALSMHQAKEFSPCEIGGLSWHGSLEALVKGPALVCALRGVNAFERLRNFIQCYVDPHGDKAACPDVFMSSTPELAYRQLSVLFHERELFSDWANRTNMDLLPPPRRLVAASENAGRKPQQGRKNVLCHDEVSVMQSLLLGPRPLATVCIVKPDAVSKHSGKILRSLSLEGFSVVAAKMALLTRQQALSTIPATVLSLKVQAVSTMEDHVRHAMSGPCLLLCLMRENAIAKLLEVLGPGDPQTAQKQSQFLLRGCYGVNSVCNALYGSEKYSTAVRDVKLFFPEGLCCPASADLMADQVDCLSYDEIFDATATRSLSEVESKLKEKAGSGSLAELPSSLLEINCVLLTPSVLLPQANQTAKSARGFAEVMEGFTSMGFQNVGLRMILLRESQAEQCVKFFGDSLPGEWQPHLLVKELVRGPCVVLAVLRSGAVTCFDSLLTSSTKTASASVRKHRNHLLVGKTIKQARQLVECFFNELMPNNKATLSSV